MTNIAPTIIEDKWVNLKALSRSTSTHRCQNREYKLSENQLRGVHTFEANCDLVSIKLEMNSSGSDTLEYLANPDLIEELMWNKHDG